MTNDELTPDQVDRAFEEITQHLDGDIDGRQHAAEGEPRPELEPRPKMLPRAWRWGRPVDMIIMLVLTVIAAALVRANYQEALFGEVTIARREELANLFTRPALIGLTTGIVLLVQGAREMHYWWAVRGGLWHAVPATHPRAGDIAWATATRRHRQLVAEHQYAVHYDGNNQTEYADCCQALRRDEATAMAAGKHRRAARLARERATLEFAARHQMTYVEAAKYAPHRQPSRVGTGLPPGTGLAVAATAGAVALGMVGAAVLGVGGYFRFMNWALRGPRR